MNILITNDDGIFATGLVEMALALRELGTVTVVAPLREQSGVAHSITFLSPLTVRKVMVDNQLWGWGVDGTPADCVRLGIQHLCDTKPDLVVSGINSGNNCGVNIQYSGTFGGAKEGRLAGINSFAVSLQGDVNDLYHSTAKLLTQIIRQTLEHQTVSPMLYNVNIPVTAVRQYEAGTMPEVRVVPSDDRIFGEKLEPGATSFGLKYYWCAANRLVIDDQQETDMYVTRQGFIAVTPLKINWSDEQQMAEMKTWNYQFTPACTEPADRCNSDGNNSDSTQNLFRPGIPEIIMSRPIERKKPDTDKPDSEGTITSAME